MKYVFRKVFFHNVRKAQSMLYTDGGKVLKLGRKETGRKVLADYLLPDLHNRKRVFQPAATKEEICLKN